MDEEGCTGDHSLLLLEVTREREARLLEHELGVAYSSGDGVQRSSAVQEGTFSGGLHHRSGRNGWDCQRCRGERFPGQPSSVGIYCLEESSLSVDMRSESPEPTSAAPLQNSMAFPPRMSTCPVIEGRYLGKTSQNQVFLTTMYYICSCHSTLFQDHQQITEFVMFWVDAWFRSLPNWYPFFGPELLDFLL